jgi:hypothetical protein
MRIHVTKPLFAWDSLEDSPTLKTIQQLLAVIPDASLLESLRVARGCGLAGTGAEHCFASSHDRTLSGGTAA